MLTRSIRVQFSSRVTFTICVSRKGSFELNLKIEGAIFSLTGTCYKPHCIEADPSIPYHERIIVSNTTKCRATNSDIRALFYSLSIDKTNTGLYRKEKIFIKFMKGGFAFLEISE
mmetsp:Transcript_16880/g.24981  ORF Transcript_16880/g.24981 Transcript_16880/m.24981 type:complete len:115 (-) Transcript_16880:87-431(-)